MKKFLFTHALAAKKKFFSLLAIFIACSTFSPLRANEVTIPDPTSGTALTTTTYLPIAINTNTTKTSCAYHSVSQQLYYASELNNNSVIPSTNTIQAITFDYQSGTNFDGDKARKLQVWMKMTSIDNFDTENGSETPHMVDPGTKVFSGNVELKSDNSTGQNGKPYTITFDTPFEWDGSSNIIVTVQDTTGTRNTASTFGGVGNTDRRVEPGATSMFADAGKVRFLHKTCTTEVVSALKGWDINSLYLAQATNISPDGRKYVNKITFTFATAAVAPSVPSDLAVSSVTANSATLTWSPVEGATSYDLEQSADGLNWNSLTTGETGTSFTWTGLSAESTQYVRVCAVNTHGSSAWSDAVTVTTDAVHSHNGINFDKWSSTNSLPTSGNWYLANNVAFGWDNTDVTLTGNLNLCLNGKTANFGVLSKIIVPDGKTLTIYDNVGGGKITSIVPGGIETSEDYMAAVIVVKEGGTLVLKEGSIENNAADDEDGHSFAIGSNGTINISGGILINSNTADFFLLASNKITISGALSNAEKHSVYRGTSGNFTSGWSTHMSGAHPSDYFTSANPSYAGVSLVDGEAKLVKALSLSDSEDNSTKLSGVNLNTPVVINLTRSFTSTQYNTVCLPFALTDEQLQSVFGSGYDLEEFSSSSLADETLNLAFNKVTELEAGKPYLIQPSQNVVNPTLDGVTITATTPTDQTSDTYISFHGTFSPKALTGGDKNLLFLGAGNELFWPEATGNLNGFRAYFEVKGAAQKVAKRARIVQKDNTATGIEEVQRDDVQCTKVLRDGQLYLMYEGKMYDVRGQRVR